MPTNNLIPKINTLRITVDRAWPIFRKEGTTHNSCMSNHFLNILKDSALSCFLN